MRALIYHRKVFRRLKRIRNKKRKDMASELDDIRDEGTDLTTVFIAESDAPLALEPEEMTVSAMQKRISAEAEDSNEPTSGLGGIPASTYEDPTQTLLGEAKEQTRLLLSINKYAFSAVVLCGALVVVAMTTMIMISASLR